MDESKLHQCPECNGKGYVEGFFSFNSPELVRTGCSNCNRSGWLDEHGEPFYQEPELKEENHANKL